MVRTSHHRKQLNKNAGFSLVELIVVIAIMAILSSLLAPALVKYINKSRIAAQEHNAVIFYDSVNAGLTDYQCRYDTNSGPHYGCDGKSNYIDPVTGKKVGRISNYILARVDSRNSSHGQLGGISDEDKRMVEHVFDDINGAGLDFDGSQAPNGKSANAFGGKTAVQIIYNEDGVIRVEYTQKGQFFTVISGDGTFTYSYAKEPNKCVFSNVN